MRRFHLLHFIGLILSSTHSFTPRHSSMVTLRANRSTPRSPSSPSIGSKRSLSVRGGAISPAPLAPFLSSSKRLVAINALGAAISVVTGSHVHLDLLGTGAFSIAARANLPKFNSVSTLSMQCISLWSVKLASFLFGRAMILGHDARLDSTLSKLEGIAGFWSLSTLWGVACLLPHSLGSASTRKIKSLPTISKIGAAMFAVGFIIETLADYQKWQFKASNPGMFANEGLWGISQHPNYLGNLLVWSGITLLNVPNLGGWKLPVAFLSPLFMVGLFNAQASGSLLDVVALEQSKYGHLKSFAAYKENTPLIWPKLW